jgi:hypothetical protein
MESLIPKTLSELGLVGFLVVALATIAYFLAKGFIHYLDKNREQYEKFLDKLSIQIDRKDELLKMQVEHNDKIVKTIEELNKCQDFSFRKLKNEHENIIGLLKKIAAK